MEQYIGKNREERSDTQPLHTSQKDPGRGGSNAGTATQRQPVKGAECRNKNPEKRPRGRGSPRRRIPAIHIGLAGSPGTDYCNGKPGQAASGEWWDNWPLCQECATGWEAQHPGMRTIVIDLE